MKLRPPSLPIFVLSLLLALAAIAGTLVPIAHVSAYAFWLAAVAYLLLALSVLLRHF